MKGVLRGCEAGSGDYWKGYNYRVAYRYAGATLRGNAGFRLR